MSNNGNKQQSKYDNNELFEVMREVGRELARSIRLKTNNTQKREEKDISVEKLKEHRKSILDMILPENNNKEDKRNIPINQTNNDNVNVVMMGKRPSISMDYYSNLFEEKNNKNNKVKTSTNKSFYERKIDAIQNKEKKLEKLRNMKNEEELKHSKIKPKMNKVSQKIMEKKKKETKPIHERVNEIVDKKYIKIDRMKQIYLDIENSQCSKIISNTNFDEKKFEEWLNRQMKWEIIKKNKLENAKMENERLETSMMRSMYHPTIDRKSEMLAKSKVLNSEQSIKNKEETIYDKLYNMKDDKYNRMVKRLVDSIPSFTPTINRHIPNYFNKNHITNNQVSSEFSRYNRNTYNTDKNKSKRLNKSVDDKPTFSVINEENDEDHNVQKIIDNYASNNAVQKSKCLNTSYGNDLYNVKSKGMNSSLIKNYENTIHNNNYETESQMESDLLTNYRKALFENKNKNNVNTIPKKMTENKSNAESIKQSNNDNSREQSFNKIDLFDQNHFKMNIKNALEWEKGKENQTVNNQAKDNKTRFSVK